VLILFYLYSILLLEYELDGASAIIQANQTAHIRPMNEFLLFSNERDDGPKVVPVYLGEAVVRGIPVDLWQSCYFRADQYRTVRRRWAFAKTNVSMPFGTVGDEAVPVQAEISATLSLPNGTEIAEVDEIFNVISYRPGIIEDNTALAPPKGVFCKSGNEQTLASLDEIGIGWPNYFSVRIDASSSRSTEWQRFHLRYNQGRDGTSRLIRYDYIPPGADDFSTVIHDYDSKLTYTIDRRLGTCQINRTTDYPDVSPIRNPIEFFIKYEADFIFSPRPKAWQFNGYRGKHARSTMSSVSLVIRFDLACRGNTIQCTIATTSLDNFPRMVDSDTGRPTGDTWSATNVEYAWSMRAPFSKPDPGSKKLFDYPVSIYMRMFRFDDPLSPSLTNLRTEDIEYEFYEMSQDLTADDFDLSTCYRSNDYEYLHVYMKFTQKNDNNVNSYVINKADLQSKIIITIMTKLSIKFTRLSDFKLVFERDSADVSVFFTILGQTRQPESGSFVPSEPTAAQIRENLDKFINTKEFIINVKTINDSDVQYQAVSDSLKDASTYVYTRVREITVVKDTESTSARNTSIILGLLIGLVVGVVLAVAIRVILKQPLPGLPMSTSISNPLPSINFSARKGNASSSTGASSA
jgi:hypothetical protein